MAPWSVPQGHADALPLAPARCGVRSAGVRRKRDGSEAIAALLHDALEDGPEYTGRDAEDLRREIVKTFGDQGEEVARLVDDATDATPKAGEEKAPWTGRKTKYLRKLKTQENASSLLVSASDKLHNARAILTDVLTAGQSAEDRAAFFSRFKQGQAGSLQYYRLLVDAYRVAPGGTSRPRLRALFDELDRTVTALEQACGVTADQVREYALLREALAG